MSSPGVPGHAVLLRGFVVVGARAAGARDRRKTLRGRVFGAASGSGWGGQHQEGGQRAGEQFVPAGSGAQDELPGVADQPGGDGDEPVAQGGDYGLAVAGAVPGDEVLT